MPEGSEPCGYLYVDSVVTGVGGDSGMARGTVVGESVVELEDEILAQVVIAREAVVGNERVPGFGIAVAVVASINFDGLGHRYAE